MAEAFFLRENEHLVVEVPGWHRVCFQPVESESRYTVYHNGWYAGLYSTLYEAITVTLKRIENECGEHWTYYAEQAFTLAMAQVILKHEQETLVAEAAFRMQPINIITPKSHLTYGNRNESKK